MTKQEELQKLIEKNNFFVGKLNNLEGLLHEAQDKIHKYQQHC